MEAKLDDGRKLEDIAKETSHQTDTDGITGFMYGCAAQALAHYWVHGEALRRWHNLDTQITDEGEKANAYSILSTLASESGYDDVDEAAAELELSPSKARALVAFSNRIARFFDEGDMLDALREIN